MKQITPDSPARERIIETGLRLFYKQGYLATGINQIIAESKVAKATFYAHFPSKESLCVAYLQARHTIWMQWLDDSVKKEDNPKAQLFNIFTFLEEWMQECDFRGCAFLNIASEIPGIDSTIRKEVTSHKNELQEYVQRIIKELLVEEPNLSPIDPTKLAKIVYVLIEGAIVASQNYHETWPILAARDAVKTLL